MKKPAFLAAKVNLNVEKDEEDLKFELKLEAKEKPAEVVKAEKCEEEKQDRNEVINEEV